MFSTSGYFRGVDCPYFASGLCERPYCHLRHVKQDEKGIEGDVTKSDDAASLLNMVGNAIKQVQKDIELDQARLETVPDANATKPNALLQPSISNLADNYTHKPSRSFTKYQKPKHKLQAPKEVTTDNKVVEYNPTPIKKLQKQTKKAKYSEYDPATNYSLFGTESSKRKSVSDNGTHVKTKRPRHEPTEPVEAQFSEEDEDNIKAPEFSDLEDSGDDEKPSDSAKKNCSSKNTKSVKSNTTNRNNGRDEFTVFEKSGTSGKSIDIVPIDDILGGKLGKAIKKEKLDEPKDNKGKSSSTTHKETSSSHEKENQLKKNIFEEFLNSDQLKAAAKKVVEAGDTHETPIKSESGSPEKSSSKHRHSSSKHKHSSSERSSKHSSSSDKDRKRSNSSNSHSSEKHDSSKRHVSGEKEHKRSSSSSKHKHSKGERESKSNHEGNSGCKHRHSSSSSSNHKHKHKDKHRHHSSNHHHKSDKSDSEKKKSDSVGLKRQVSHAELFGEESDSDCSAKVEEPKSKPVILIDDNNSDVIEINSDASDYDGNGLPDLSSDDDDIKQPKTGKTDKGSQDHADQTDSSNLAVGVGKKRVAHAGQSNSSVRKAPKSHRKLSPSEVMHNRFMELQKRAAEAAQAVQEAADDLKKVKTPVTSSSLGASKKRTAHAVAPKPFMGSEALAKKPTLAVKPKPKELEPLMISTQKKGTSRVAHVPKISTLKRPTIPTEFGSKVASNIRQRYLNQIIDECLRIYPDEKDAFDRGLAEEKAIYDRSSSRVVYLNVAVNAIKRLRAEAPREPGPDTEEEEVKSPKVTSPIKQKNTYSHMAVIGGAKAAKISYTLHRSKGVTIKIPDKFVGADLYKRLNWYVMSEDLLVSNSFPRPDPEKPGYAVITRELPKNRRADLNEKICARCGKIFQVTDKGQYVTKEACMYHWGKNWKRKVAGAVDNRWTCCQEYSSAKGCTLAPLHVFDHNRYEDLSGYVSTKPCAPVTDGDYKCYSLDCEMIYTTAGSEIARISVVGPDLKSVYESLIQPGHHIVDYNTRFSGLTEEELKGVTITLEDVQKKLLRMFSDKTILIGHSLESDLIALKMIHDTVIDTSVVFPHRMGPPYKRALQTLMAEILQRIIQNDVGGHDSIEDAASCMELMMWKLKEDAKKAARR